MTIIKRIICVLLVVALATTIAFSVVTSIQQNKSGRYSSVTTITEKSRQWLLEQFGHCQTVPELLEAIDDFGCENFVYEDNPIVLIQAFNLDKFLFEDNFHGVCFDFSCFVKCAVLVWQEAHGRQDVQVFVYDVRLCGKDANLYEYLSATGHSYNFIMEDGHTWFLCLTNNSGRVARGDVSLGAVEITGMSPEEYAERYEEVVIRFY